MAERRVLLQVGGRHIDRLLIGRGTGAEQALNLKRVRDPGDVALADTQLHAS